MTVTSMYRDDDKTGSVVVEEVFGTDPADLWQALTDPDRLRRWIGEVTGDLRLGGTVAVKLTSTYEGTSRITVCEPPSRLEMTTDDLEEGGGTLQARLTPADDGTRLRIEESGLRLDKLHFHGAGWTVHVEDLGAVLRGDEPSDWQTRWKELVPDYEFAPVLER